MTRGSPIHARRGSRTVCAPLDPRPASCHSPTVPAPCIRFLLLLAGVATGGCGTPAPPTESPPSAPAGTVQSSETEHGVPTVPVTAPPSPRSTTGTEGAAIAIPVVVWPAGFSVTRSGTIGGPAAPAAWFELQARGLGVQEAARRALEALTALAGSDALSDLAAAKDGRSVIAQVRGSALSAVIAASATDGGSNVRVTLEPRR